ncbi:acetylxylan esterase [Blastopirellula retiformator]|uniref:Acetyl xylan esterase domain-containing protein n=1 Tax=Blastopirellula retiformator TaxID=2527970 RepID=A0A5C5V868_9BACT|nr:acetylxylan esterase [Blastopirellula retiformator]TWT34756.1 hypothetical protein Enr8_21700 [Blastopirellula retiformator]
MNALLHPNLARCGLAILLPLMLSQLSVAAEPAWLEKAITPPPGITMGDSQTLQAANGVEIRTLDQWKPKRAAIDAEWRQFLGAYRYPELPLEIETLETERFDHYTRTLIRYQAEPGRRVRAYLLKPHDPSSQKLPAIVAFHGTNAKTFQKLVGLDARRSGISVCDWWSKGSSSSAPRTICGKRSRTWRRLPPHYSRIPTAKESR